MRARSIERGQRRIACGRERRGLAGPRFRSRRPSQRRGRGQRQLHLCHRPAHCGPPSARCGAIRARAARAAAPRATATARDRETAFATTSTSKSLMLSSFRSYTRGQKTCRELFGSSSVSNYRQRRAETSRSKGLSQQARRCVRLWGLDGARARPSQQWYSGSASDREHHPNCASGRERFCPAARTVMRSVAAAGADELRRGPTMHRRRRAGVEHQAIERAGVPLGTLWKTSYEHDPAPRRVRILMLTLRQQTAASTGLPPSIRRLQPWLAPRVPASAFLGTRADGRDPRGSRAHAGGRAVNRAGGWERADDRRRNAVGTTRASTSPLRKVRAGANEKATHFRALLSDLLL